MSLLDKFRIIPDFASIFQNAPTAVLIFLVFERQVYYLAERVRAHFFVSAKLPLEKSVAAFEVCRSSQTHVGLIVQG